jgi:hypothetical protein
LVGWQTTAQGPQQKQQRRTNNATVNEESLNIKQDDATDKQPAGNYYN